jgi:hypothetical protein
MFSLLWIEILYCEQKGPALLRIRIKVVLRKAIFFLSIWWSVIGGKQKTPSARFGHFRQQKCPPMEFAKNSHSS